MTKMHFIWPERIGLFFNDLSKFLLVSDGYLRLKTEEVTYFTIAITN